MLAVAIGFVITCSVLGSAALDYWVQLLIHLVLMLALIFWVWTTPFSTIVSAPKNKRPFVLWSVVLLLLFLSLKYSGDPLKSLEAYWIWIDCALLYFFASHLTKTQTDRLDQYLFVPWGILIVGAFIEWSRSSGHPPQVTLLNSNALAAYLIIPVCLGLEKMSLIAKPSPLTVIYTALSLLCMLTTRSVGACIALLGALSFIVHTDPRLPKRLKQTGAILLPVLTFSFLIIKLAFSWDTHRWLLWKSAAQMIADRPLWGFGARSFEMGLHQRLDLNQYSIFTHNTYLQWGVENGLLALGGLLLLIGYSLSKQKNTYRAAACLGLMIHNLYDFSLILPSHAFLFWFLLGWKDPSDDPRHPPTKTDFKMAFLATAIFLGAAIVQINHFLAQRAFSKGSYALERADLSTSRNCANQGLQKEPLSADGYFLLSRAASLESSLKPSNALLCQSLSYALMSVDQEPVQTTFWVKALQVYNTLGLHADEQALKSRLFQTYPHLRNDKRFLRESNS